MSSAAGRRNCITNCCDSASTRVPISPVCRIEKERVGLAQIGDQETVADGMHRIMAKRATT